MPITLTPVTAGSLTFTPLSVGSVTLGVITGGSRFCSESLKCSDSLTCSGIAVVLAPLVAV